LALGTVVMVVVAVALPLGAAVTGVAPGDATVALALGAAVALAPVPAVGGVAPGEATAVVPGVDGPGSDFGALVGEFAVPPESRLGWSAAVDAAGASRTLGDAIAGDAAGGSATVCFA
jgi:hypothetical protein